MKQTLGAVLVGALALTLWVALLFPAEDGWGYMGHNGHASTSSFWYFGGVREYPARASARTGSVGGPGNVGRGPGVGK